MSYNRDHKQTNIHTHTHTTHTHTHTTHTHTHTHIHTHTLDFCRRRGDGAGGFLLSIMSLKEPLRFKPALHRVPIVVLYTNFINYLIIGVLLHTVCVRCVLLVLTHRLHSHTSTLTHTHTHKPPKKKLCVSLSVSCLCSLTHTKKKLSLI